MGRIFNQKNVWGSQGGIDPQRADFWTVDFTQVIRGINSQIFDGDADTDLQALTSVVEPYYIASVAMPTLKVKADEFRRDSRPYMMPGFDEALPEIKVTFILDTPIDARTSKIYTFMDTWRAFVRAGRGAMGNERSVSTLNKNFRIDFRFPVTITLLRGNKSGKVNQVSRTLAEAGVGNGIDLNAVQNQLVGLSEVEKNNRMKSMLAGVGLATDDVENPLESCAVFQLENMWLSSFKATDLDYSKGNEIVKIEATFFADNIRDLNQQ